MTTREELIDLALEPTATEWGSSRWAELRRCEVAYDIAYGKDAQAERERRVNLPVAQPLDVGSLVHYGLGYAGLLVLHGFEPDDLDIRAVLSKAPGEGAAKSEAQRLLTTYFLKYGYANAGWGSDYKIVAVEQYYETKLGPLPYTTRIDVELLDAEGRTVIVDHKTRGRAVPYDAEQVWQTRSQFLGSVYAVLQDRQGSPDPMPRFLTNAIVKTKVPGFERVELPFDRVEVFRWASNQELLAAKHYTNTKRGSTPIANYDACAPEIGFKCWAFDRCHPTLKSKKLVAGFEVE